MASNDNFSSIPADGGILYRAAIVTFGYQVPQNCQNGSLAQPGIAFLNAPGSGIYLYPDNKSIGIVQNGVEAITITDGKVIFAEPATGLITAKEPSTLVVNPGGSYALNFNPVGNATFVIRPNAPLTLTLNVGTATVGQRQELHVIIQQPTTGGFAVTLSMPDVRFARNSAGVPLPPVVSTKGGDETPLQFTWNGQTDTVFGSITP